MSYEIRNHIKAVLPEGRDEISKIFSKISPKIILKQKKLQKPSKLAFKGF